MTQARAIQISKQVYLVGSGVMGLSERHDCHTYLVDAGTALFLVDAGCGIEPKRIEENVRSLGFDPRRMSHVLLTHSHPDHAGGASYFARAWGSLIGAGEVCAARVSQPNDVILCLDVSRPEGVYPPDYVFEAAPVARVFADGDEFTIGECRLQALSIPGHSDCSVVYLAYLSEGTALFAGDSLRTDNRIALLNTYDSDLNKIRQSMRRLASLEFDALYPGHGVFVLSGGRAVAQRLHERLSTSITVPPCM